MNANLFDEIYNGLDHAMSCYLDTKAAKAGNVVKIYGTDFGGEFGKAQNLNTVEMYAIYSNRKNKSGNYNLKGFNVIVTKFETGETKTFESVTEAMEFVAHLMNEENNETDENDIMEETDDMYQYASEAAEEIEILANSVDKDYSEIIAEMKHDEPDIEYAMDRVFDMYHHIKGIKNELEWCLQRCDERTGCHIVWDDFCTADYFASIEIYGDFDCPSYSIDEFINDYNCDAADFMNTLIENIWKSLEGQNGDTFRNAIADLDMPFYIAA